MQEELNTRLLQKISYLEKGAVLGMIVCSCFFLAAILYFVKEMCIRDRWERAEALINIAHPDFRDELIKEAEKMHIWRRSNK